MPNGWKLYSRQWAFWAPSIELTLHTTLHCSNLTLSFSPSLALNWEDGRSTCATYTLEHQPWSENQKCPMSVSWIGRYLNYGPHCTVRSVIMYLPKHTLGRSHFEHYSVPSQSTLPASRRLIAGPSPREWHPTWQKAFARCASDLQSFFANTPKRNGQL